MEEDPILENQVDVNSIIEQGLTEMEGIPSEPEPEVVEPEPEVIAQGQYAAPFSSPIGKSTVNLTIPENLEQQKADYDEWWNFG